MIEMNKLAGLLSYSEQQVTVALTVELDGREEMSYVASALADKLKLTRSVLVNTQNKLEIAGLIETRSMGTKGTRVKVLDQDALKQLAKLIG